jgi:hypothetical protein
MIERFEKSSLLEGELNVSIQSISNRININLLRTSAFLDLIKEQNKKQNTPGTTPPSTNPPDPNDPFAPKPPDPKPPEPNENEKEKENPIEHLEKRLIELIQVSIDKKIEEDENFELLHGNTDVEELVASIKYFISDPNTDVGPLTNQIVSEFQKNGIEPKNAPLTSISELYLLPGWTHEIIELIKNDITVHGEAVIDLNKLTGQLLKALFPELTDEDITEFFKNKNNPETNVYFNTIDELKNYFVENTRVLEKSYADERVELFVKAGIKFGSAPLLFRIVSTGKYQDTNYTLNVIATIPTEMEEVAPPQTGAGGTGGSTSQPGSKPATPPTGTTGQTGEKKPPNTIFKQPKIVMYLVN